MAGDPEFDLVAGFKARPAPYLIRHGEGSLVSDGDGHGIWHSWDSTSLSVEAVLGRGSKGGKGQRTCPRFFSACQIGV